MYLTELITSTEDDYHSTLSTRHASIRLWLQRRRPDYAGPWLALDDEYRSWPPEDRDHLVVAWGTLANPAVQEELAARLAQAIAGQCLSAAHSPTSR